MYSGHEAIDALIRSRLPEDAQLILPPPAFEAFRFQMEEYAPGEYLRGSFETLPGFANPSGVFLGGATTAAIDIALGSLAFLEARAPCTSVTMESSFIRPLFPDGRRCAIEARIREKTRSFLFLEGSARNPEGKLAVTVTSTMAILAR